MSQNKQIAILANGSNKIGAGHIIRCSAIAEKFFKNEYKIFWITTSYNFVKSLVNKKFIIKKIANNTPPLIYKTVNKIKTKILIIDNYYITPDLFNFLKQKNIKIVCFDDNNEHNSPTVDLLINGNIHAKSINYRTNNTILLLGPKYIPLRQDFEKAKPIIFPETPSSVLLTLGGGNNSKLLSTIAAKLCDLPWIRKVLIMPGSSKLQHALLERNRNKIKVLKKSENIVAFMRKAHLAISGSGSTLYELWKLGIPSVIINMADNQSQIVKNAIAQKLAVYGGDLANIKIDNIIDTLSALAKNKTLRYKIYLETTKLIDGKGASRCYKYISKLIID